MVHVVGKPGISKNKHTATEIWLMESIKESIPVLKTCGSQTGPLLAKKYNHSGFILKTETMSFHSIWKHAQFLLRHTDVLAELELLALCEGVSIK